MTSSFNIKSFQLLILAALTSVALLPAKAFCRLSAEAEINYVNLDVRDNSSQQISAHALTQRYSLLYQTEGRLAEGRLGKYNLALGYDWTTFDTTIKTESKSDNPSASRGHILYRGELLIDPKEMPIRLTAFSRDMSRSTFTEDYSNLLGMQSGYYLSGSPRLATGIYNGIHIDSGATLVMGVKNGMTNGYNELLRHFPMLMLDYRDIINRDLNSTFPVNDRLTRLAFVSLNKKDNWFHYRLISYNDYINPEYSYKESQIQLGTIDQTMQRRWIDFANWLQVSADGQLIRRTTGMAKTAIASDNYSEFDLNLFGIARRATWEARSFNNFNRKKQDDGLIIYHTTTPIYANGVLSADTSWSSRFTYKDDHDNRNNTFSDVSGGYRIDAYKRSPFTLSQQLDLERAATDSRNMFVISGTLETTSTSRFSRTLHFGAAYEVHNYAYGGAADVSNFLDQAVRATVDYTPSNEFRLSLLQTVRVTSGSSQYLSSNVEGANVTSPQYVNPRNYQGDNGASNQSITSLRLAWNPLPRLNIGLSVTEDIYDPKRYPTSYQTTINQTIDYYGANFKLSSTNSYSYDNIKQTTCSNSFTSRNRAEYIYNRNINSQIGVIYYKSFDNSAQADILYLDQRLNYNYYKVNGLTRKLFEINEAIDHTEGNSSGASNSPIGPDAYSTPIANIVTVNRNSKRNTNLTLGFKYYPVRQLLLAAGARYSFFSSFSDYSLTYYGSIGINYRLLQASLDYVYGTNRSDGRIEKKFMANFRKIF